jgi:hypothetical protein
MFSVKILNGCGILSQHGMPNQTGIRKMLGENIPQDGAITKACKREEADMIERSRTQLQNKGVTLEDLKHVKHTQDGWLHNADECLPHF